eukprot:11202228-Prorocentrum_lima.AAC.1
MGSTHDAVGSPRSSKRTEIATPEHFPMPYVDAHAEGAGSRSRYYTVTMCELSLSSHTSAAVTTTERNNVI